MSMDTWVQSVIIEAMKEGAKYLVIQQLKPQIEEKIPREKREEFRKRLTQSISRLKLKDTDLVLRLRDYPGILPYLESEEFRKKHLLLDTGQGVVVLDSATKGMIEQFSASYGVLQFKILSMLD